MHVLVLVVIVVAIAYLYFRSQKYAAQPQTASAASLSVNTDPGQAFIFISKGKLFIKHGALQVEQIHSPYVQEMIDRMERRKQLHGWKENTTLNTSFTGGPGKLSTDQIDLQVISAQFTPDNKLLYFLRDSNIGGLFEYDMQAKTERRILHKQNLCYENLVVNPGDGRILCSQHHASGIANIMLLDRDGANARQLTEGDTVDYAPAWIPGEADKILYQSAGLARSEEGYAIAHGPAAIKLLNLGDHSVVNVLEDPALDYLQPRVDSQGYLYFIRRPYEAQGYGSVNMFTDFLLFPFRLLRAVFHYLNFFSLMYSRKPLTSASGPQLKADLKDILIKGKRIDAEKALRKESRVGGIPSLVPKSWQLVRRSRQGEEVVLATNVASFDITSSDQILYSNGYAVFQLGPEQQAHIILRDKLIADVIAS